MKGYKRKRLINLITDLQTKSLTDKVIHICTGAPINPE